MSEAQSFTVAFDLSLYDRDAVQQAVDTLSSAAALELSFDGERGSVTARDVPPTLVRRLRGELCNFALGLTVGGQR